MKKTNEFKTLSKNEKAHRIFTWIFRSMMFVVAALFLGVFIYGAVKTNTGSNSLYASADSTESAKSVSNIRFATTYGLDYGTTITFTTTSTTNQISSTIKTDSGSYLQFSNNNNPEGIINNLTAMTLNLYKKGSGDSYISIVAESNTYYLMRLEFISQQTVDGGLLITAKTSKYNENITQYIILNNTQFINSNTVNSKLWNSILSQILIDPNNYNDTNDSGIKNYISYTQTTSIYTFMYEKNSGQTQLNESITTDTRYIQNGLNTNTEWAIKGISLTLYYNFNNGSGYINLNPESAGGTQKLYKLTRVGINGNIEAIQAEPNTQNDLIVFLNKQYLENTYIKKVLDNTLSISINEFYNQGNKTGYDNGYKEGEDKGYQNGYNNGYTEGSNGTFNPIGMILQPAADFLEIKIFGDFSIGSFLGAALFISVALIFLKMFAGG